MARQIEFTPLTGAAPHPTFEKVRTIPSDVPSGAPCDFAGEINLARRP
jgi:hypothetical protein